MLGIPEWRAYSSPPPMKPKEGTALLMRCDQKVLEITSVKSEDRTCLKLVPRSFKLLFLSLSALLLHLECYLRILLFWFVKHCLLYALDPLSSMSKHQTFILNFIFGRGGLGRVPDLANRTWEVILWILVTKMCVAQVLMMTARYHSACRFMNVTICSFALEIVQELFDCTS